MRVGHRQPVGIDRRFRIDGEFLDGAAGQHHADGFFLLRGRGRRLVAGRDQRARDHPALRRTGAGTAGEGVQQARGAAGGGGGERIIRYFDVPGALAYGNPRQRRLVAGLQPSLRDAACGTPRPTLSATAGTARPAGRARMRRGRGNRSSRGWSLKGDPGWRVPSFRPKYPADNASAPGTLMSAANTPFI